LVVKNTDNFAEDNTRQKYHVDRKSSKTNRCLTIKINAMSRESTVGHLGCVLEGQQSTVHCRKRLPMAGSMMGWQYENPPYCCRQTPSRQLATDEINLSNVHYNAKVSRLHTSRPVKPGSTRIKFIPNFATLI